MAAGRRTQRSVRVMVAAGVLTAAALVVALAVVSDTMVSAAAVFAVLAGVGAAKIVHAEVLQSRRDLADLRVEQARAMRMSLAAENTERLALATLCAGRLAERDATIARMGGALLASQRRADEAEARVLREARRANEAQERLGALLDEVLGTAGPDVDADRQGDLAELPMIVGRLGWDRSLSLAVPPA